MRKCNFAKVTMALAKQIKQQSPLQEQKGEDFVVYFNSTSIFLFGKKEKFPS